MTCTYSIHTKADTTHTHAHTCVLNGPNVCEHVVHTQLHRYLHTKSGPAQIIKHHTAIYIYISYIPSNSFIVYLSANPLIHRSAGQSQVALRVARGAANAWWAAANSSLAQQGDPLGSELAI